MTQDRVAFPKVTVIFELNTTLWTATDTSPLSADYVVHHVPVPSESAAGYEFKAEGLENLIRSMGSSFYKLIDLGRALYCFALISARTMVELVFAASTSAEVDAESCRYVVRDHCLTFQKAHCQWTIQHQKWPIRRKYSDLCIFIQMTTTNDSLAGQRGQSPWQF
jgi:hypothetical protein